MSELSSFDEQLRLHGRIIYTNVGHSMMPLIKEGRDVMIIERPEGRLKKYDIPLYVRPSGQYVLHRILEVREGSYVISGDNCSTREAVSDEQIIGVLTGIIRRGRTLSLDRLSYKIYTHLWCDLFPIRAFIIRWRDRLRSFASRLLRRLGLRKNTPTGKT
jgi:hypothetical protein